MSPLLILLPRRVYLEHFGSKIAKIVRCYCHDLGQSERNISYFSLCLTVLLWGLFKGTLKLWILFWSIIKTVWFSIVYLKLQGGLKKVGNTERMALPDASWPRGSSELVLLASQLTKPLKLKRLFPSLVCFLNPSPEAPSSIDLKRENMNSILIITNLTCWLLVSWLRLLKWLLLGRL